MTTIKDITTITVTREIHELLLNHKNYTRETFDDLLRRILKRADRVFLLNKQLNNHVIKSGDIITRNINELKPDECYFIGSVPIPNVDELAESIKNHGQLEPIVIIDNIIIHGYRRWLACSQLGIDTIECREYFALSEYGTIGPLSELHRFSPWFARG